MDLEQAEFHLIRLSQVVFVLQCLTELQVLKVIETGDLVTSDFGCYYNGYVSDMTRTIAVGEPIDQLKEIHDVVFQAQLK